MRTDKPEFDAQLYKQQSREIWNESAEPWYNGRALLAEWLTDATEMMFDMAGMTAGHRVLDIAAGAGDQSIAAAKRVGPSGSVLATDLSENILLFAERNARQEGVTNMETRRIDAEELDTLDHGSFDAAICRLGLMLMPNPVKALEGVRHALQPGSAFAGIVFSAPEKNPLLSIPAAVILKRAGLPMPKPGTPGIFSMANPDVFEQALKSAGFKDIEVRTIPASMSTPTCKDFMEFLRGSAGALKRIVATMTEAEQAETWREVETALMGFEGGGAFRGPCELHIGAGRK